MRKMQEQVVARESDAITQQKSERLIPYARVIFLTSLSRRSIQRMQQEGLFPRAIRLSTQRVAWRESDVEHWIATRELTLPDS
jgi:prophage regulatory protein